MSSDLQEALVATLNGWDRIPGNDELELSEWVRDCADYYEVEHRELLAAVRRELGLS